MRVQICGYMFILILHVKYVGITNSSLYVIYVYIIKRSSTYSGVKLHCGQLIFSLLSYIIKYYTIFRQFKRLFKRQTVGMKQRFRLKKRERFKKKRQRSRNKVRFKKRKKRKNAFDQENTKKKR